MGIYRSQYMSPVFYVNSVCPNRCNPQPERRAEQNTGEHSTAHHTRHFLLAKVQDIFSCILQLLFFFGLWVFCFFFQFGISTFNSDSFRSFYPKKLTQTKKRIKLQKTKSAKALSTEIPANSSGLSTCNLKHTTASQLTSNTIQQASRKT